MAAGEGDHLHVPACVVSEFLVCVCTISDIYRVHSDNLFLTKTKKYIVENYNSKKCTCLKINA